MFVECLFIFINCRKPFQTLIKKIDLEKLVLYVYSLLPLINSTSKLKRNPRYLKGLVTSQNVGYLFYFFLRMEGCRKEKNFCEFEQSLILKQNISLAFDEKKIP